MKLHILFGQRKCAYNGQYAPEALEIADENTMSDNGGWLPSKEDYYRETKEFSSLAVIVVKVPDYMIDYALAPKVVEVDGVIVKQ